MRTHAHTRNASHLPQMTTTTTTMMTVTSDYTISDVLDKMLPPSSDKTIYPRQNDIVERKQLDLSDVIVIGNPSRVRPQDVFTTSVFRFTDIIIMYTSYTNTRTRALPLHLLKSTHGACMHLCEFENIVEPIWVQSYTSVRAYVSTLTCIVLVNKLNLETAKHISIIHGIKRDIGQT